MANELCRRGQYVRGAAVVDGEREIDRIEGHGDLAQAVVAEGHPKGVQALIVVAYEGDFYASAAMGENPFHLYRIHVLGLVNAEPAHRQGLHSAIEHAPRRAQEDVVEVHGMVCGQRILVCLEDALELQILEDIFRHRCFGLIHLLDDIIQLEAWRIVLPASSKDRHAIGIGDQPGYPVFGVSAQLIECQRVEGAYGDTPSMLWPQ